MSKRKPNQWMPLHIDSFYAKTRHLSRLERHAYLDLLFNYWRTQGPLANDDSRLARIADMTAEEWESSKGVILEFFTEKNGLLHQARIDEEIAKANRISSKRQAAGKKGGNAKANAKQEGSNCLPSDNQVSTNEEPDGYTRACTGSQSATSIETIVSGLESEWGESDALIDARADARKNSYRGVA